MEANTAGTRGLRTRGAIAAGALLATALGGGTAAALSQAASAEEGSSGSGYGYGAPGRPGSPGDRGPGGREGEEALTGDTLQQVTDAVLAEYPDAEILRAETDADGATYEAHIVTADGEHLTVLLDADFAITGTETGPAGGGGCGPGGGTPPEGAPSGTPST